MTQPAGNEPAPLSGQSGIRLDFLDGLRGLAALYVVIFHIYIEINWVRDGGRFPPFVQRICVWMGFGHYAVAIFIVLSGYCLMLPVARSAEGVLRGGVSLYLKRRAQRILPPYYAALVLSLLMIVLVPDMNRLRATTWDSAVPALNGDVIVSHILLIHNLNSEWAHKINPPMWSVATEWHIYFIFPLMLLPIWRRFGATVMTLSGLLVGYSLYALFFPRLLFAAPWYIGLFAMGAAGASVTFSNRYTSPVWDRVPWGICAGLLWTTLIGIAVGFPRLMGHIATMDLPVGLASVCLIVYCARSIMDKDCLRQPVIVRCLEARGPVGLGHFSYSLYLMHLPVLSLLHLYLDRLALSPPTEYAVLLFAGVPLSLVTANLFFLAFERRFMPGHLRSQQASERPMANPSLS